MTGGLVCMTTSDFDDFLDALSRQQFEAWASAPPRAWSVERGDDWRGEHYTYSGTSAAWDGWDAAARLSRTWRTCDTFPVEERGAATVMVRTADDRVLLVQWQAGLNRWETLDQTEDFKDHWLKGWMPVPADPREK